ncbi:MAG: cytochrome c-type biogenesis protein [Pseudomonadota bacterium]
MHGLRVAIIAIGLIIGNSQAVEIRSFNDPELDRRYHALIAELRCLVCQNQSLADSDADLAKDLRRKVSEMLVAGESDRAITDYMVERFGDFVLYRPPLRPSTLALWFGPFALALFGFWFLVRHVRRSRATKQSDLDSRLSDAEESRLRDILTDPESSNANSPERGSGR